MCLLIAAEGNKPSEDLLRRAARANSDGAGIAWIADGAVRWEKSLDDDRIIRLAMSEHIRPPFIVHFRFATAGGVTDGLCHPFPVTEKVTTARRGSTPGAVLAHNGHWHGWEEHIMLLAARSGRKLPGGQWSDTRAIAWTAGLLGDGALQLIDEKVTLLTPSGIVRFGSGWHNLQEVYLSNRSDLPYSGSLKSAAAPQWDETWEDACRYVPSTKGTKGKGKSTK